MFDYERAKYHYEEAIKINPQDSTAHNNLGALLSKHFFDFKGAKYHYEEAIRIDPGDQTAEDNLAGLIKNHFS